MGHRSTAEKALILLTAVGGLLVIGALALFSLSGSGLGSDLLRGAAGGVLGTMTVAVLTRSPRRGRHIAALLLLACVVGSFAFVLVGASSMSATVADGRSRMGFIAGLLSAAIGASLLRLLGINLLAFRGDQAPRRRS